MAFFRTSFFGKGITRPIKKLGAAYGQQMIRGLSGSKVDPPIDFFVSKSSRDNLILVRRDFAELNRRLSARRALFQAIRDEVLIPSIKKNFAAGGRGTKKSTRGNFYVFERGEQRNLGGPPNRGTWAPIKDSSLESRKARKSKRQKHPPLYDTGAMRRAAVSKQRFNVSKDQMTYGDWPGGLQHAALHDMGWPARNTPARPFALIQTEDIPKIERLTLQWLHDNAKFMNTRTRRYGSRGIGRFHRRGSNVSYDPHSISGLPATRTSAFR